MSRPLTLGYSPCPNDTFIFHALIHNCIPLPPGLTVREQLADVETLNQLDEYEQDEKYEIEGGQYELDLDPDRPGIGRHPGCGRLLCFEPAAKSVWQRNRRQTPG